MISIAAKILYLFALLFLFGCGTSKTISRKDHLFGQRPSKIIWIQIAGLAEEQLAMLRFSSAEAIALTNMESMLCFGKAWNYNLLKVRPSARDGFLAQMVGKGLINGNCEDYKLGPLWKYLRASDSGMRAGIFETSSESNLYSDLTKCSAANESGFASSLFFWEMMEAPSLETKTFHSLEKTIFSTPSVYFDKSCKGNNCYSSVLENINSVYNRFVTRPKERFLFIVRDFNYQKALAEKNIVQAKEILMELDSVVAYFNNLIKKDDEILLLVTSSGPRPFEFPTEGKEWAEFDLKGKNVLYRSTALMSPVFASGARAENFCGIFEESDIMSRIITDPRKRTISEIFNDLF